MKPKHIKRIKSAAEIAQTLINKLHASDPKNESFEQIGLLDGQAIVMDFINEGEPGCALEHLFYMVNESEISFPSDILLELQDIAKYYGVKNSYIKNN